MRVDVGEVFSAVGYGAVGLGFLSWLAAGLSGSSRLLMPFAAGAVAGGVIVGGWQLSCELGRIAKEDARQRDINARQRQLLDNQHRDSFRQLHSEVQEACGSAVRWFESLPRNLDAADGWMTEAKRHLANGAYSPFWSAIEQAYTCLGNYNHGVGMIGELSRRYTSAVRRLTREVAADRLPAFPIQVGAAEAAQASGALTGELDSLVYAAQREPVFAQIWEQRRTTAAVIVGFSNLEAAITQMATCLQESVASLNQSIASLTADLGRVRGQLAANAAETHTLGAAQLVAQTHLNKRVDQAIHFLRQHERREMGGWA